MSCRPRRSLRNYHATRCTEPHTRLRRQRSVYCRCGAVLRRTRGRCQRPSHQVSVPHERRTPDGRFRRNQDVSARTGRKLFGRRLTRVANRRCRNEEPSPAMARVLVFPDPSDLRPYESSGRTIRGRTMPGAAAPGKVRPLMKPQAIEIEDQEFGDELRKPTVTEQSTSPSEYAKGPQNFPVVLEAILRRCGRTPMD